MKFKLFASVCVAAGLAFGLAGCGDDNAPKSGDAKTLTVGASPVPHADILNLIAPQLQKEGITLKVIEFSDYIQPNLSLNDKELDANFFQHKPYLDSFSKDRGLKLTSLVAVHIEPMGVYSHKVKNVADVAEGSEVAIPNDPTNGGRALKVLEAAGLIKLKDSADFNPTIDDIETYNTKITIEELKANVIPSTLADVTAAVVNGNYALDFGLKTEDAIYKDDQLDIEEYWNLIAARSADLEDADKLETYKKVVAAFQSDETEAVFNDQFGGYFIKAGWDQDLLAGK